MRYTGFAILVIVGMLVASASQAAKDVQAPQAAPSLWQDASLTLATPEDLLKALTVDSAAGFLYMGAMDRHENFPAVIIKLRLSDLSRVATLPLEADEKWITSGAFDSAAGYGYFVAKTGPAHVIKVRLADLSRVATLALPAGEDNMYGAFVDPDGGYLYLSGGTSLNGIVTRIRLADFSYQGTLTVTPSGWWFLDHPLFDRVNGQAFFATEGTTDQKLVRVQLDSFSQTGILDMPGTIAGGLAVVDSTGEYAYYGASGSSTYQILKMRLADSTFVDALVLPAGDVLGGGVIDTTAGTIYVGIRSTPGRIIQIRLSDFTRVGEVVLGGDDNYLTWAAHDATTGMAYFGLEGDASADEPARLIQVRLADLTRLAGVTLHRAQSYPHIGVLDSQAGYAYVVPDNYNGPALEIVKIDLATFQQTASLVLPTHHTMQVGLFDAESGYAYFADGNVPTSIFKVDLSTFTLAGTLTLTIDESDLTSGVLDPVGGYAYFAIDNNPGQILKVRLSDLTRVDALTLNSGETFLDAAVIDPATHIAYFAAETSPGQVVKVDLTTFSRAGALSFNAGENNPRSAAIDTASGFAYFGLHTQPAQVVKVNLSNLTRVGVLQFAGGENYADTAVLRGQHAYFGLATSPGDVVQVNLPDFTRQEAITLTPDTGGLNQALLDEDTGYLYFVTPAQPGVVSRVRYSPHSSYLPWVTR
jgi:hypothetical protein